MALVIGDFEVLAPPAAPAPAGDAAASARQEAADLGRPEPQELQPVLRVLELQALRVWAH